MGGRFVDPNQQREHLNGALKKQIFSISLDSREKQGKQGGGVREGYFTADPY